MPARVRCCVSKARHAPGLIADEQRERRRAELLHLRVTVLQERAVAAGVHLSAVDDALESDDTKGALIALLLEAEETSDAVDERLRVELQGLRVSALSTRALSDGVSQEQVDEALEGDFALELVVEGLVDGTDAALADLFLDFVTVAHESGRRE